MSFLIFKNVFLSYDWTITLYSIKFIHSIYSIYSIKFIHQKYHLYQIYEVRRKKDCSSWLYTFLKSDNEKLILTLSILSINSEISKEIGFVHPKSWSLCHKHHNVVVYCFFQWWKHFLGFLTLLCLKLCIVQRGSMLVG